MNCGYSKQPQLSTVSSPRSPRQVSHFTAGALKPHFLPSFLLKASSLSNIQRYSHCHHHHRVVANLVFIPKIYWRDKLFLSFYSSTSLLPKILKTLTKIKLSTTSLVFLEFRLVQMSEEDFNRLSLSDFPSCCLLEHTVISCLGQFYEGSTCSLDSCATVKYTAAFHRDDFHPGFFKNTHTFFEEI